MHASVHLCVYLFQARALICMSPFQEAEFFPCFLSIYFFFRSFPRPPFLSLPPPSSEALDSHTHTGNRDCRRAGGC